MSYANDWPFVYSTLTSDLPVPEQARSLTGVLRALRQLDGTDTYIYVWVDDARLWSTICRVLFFQSYQEFDFTPFSSRSLWRETFPHYQLQSQDYESAIYSSPRAIPSLPPAPDSISDPPDPPSLPDTHLDDSVVFSPHHLPSVLPTITLPRRGSQIPASISTSSSSLRSISRSSSHNGSTSSHKTHSAPRSVMTLPPPPPRPPPRAPSPIPSNHIDIPSLIAQLHQNSQQVQHHNQLAFLEAIKELTPSATTLSFVQDRPPTFPKWDGTPDTIPMFLENVRTHKQHIFYSGVNWDHNLPSASQQSTHLRQELLRHGVLPVSVTSQFVYEPDFANDGFAMLRRVLDIVEPSGQHTKLLALAEFNNLNLGPDESWEEYLARMRGIALRLSDISILDLLPLQGISRMGGRFDGIYQRYQNGDIRDLSLSSLAREFKEFTARMTLSSEYAHASQVKRASTHAGGTPSAVTLSPTLPPNTTPSGTYPPSSTKGSDWDKVSALITATKQCPVCFTLDKFHLDVGCVPLARAGKVLVADESLSKEVLAQWSVVNKERRRKKNSGSTQSTSVPSPQTPAPSSTPSGRRATSADRRDASSGTYNRYLDLEIDSDSDSALDDDPKINDQSTSYMYPSARRATIRCNYVSSTLASLARQELLTHSRSISVTTDNNLTCCADTGATDMMFPEYQAFVSYHKTPGRFVTLGDTTQIPIQGVGTAKVRLNGKVVVLRNVLHVPDLRAPLYSLRRHRMMPGCGFLSHYDTGSHLFFPTFTLEVNDTVDTLISYQPIGRDPSSPPDYVEPRLHPPRKGTRSQHVTADLDHVASPPTSDDTAHPREPIPHHLLSTLHPDPADLPPVPPSATPGPGERRVLFDDLTLHRIFGCRKFRTPRNLIVSSSNAQLIQCGELPHTFGDITTMDKAPRGGPLEPPRRYLHKVHMDVVFGDCLAIGGFRYALLLVDMATRYCWIFGLSSVSSKDIIAALEDFRVSAHGLPATLHCDFDQKLIGGDTLRWIKQHNVRLIAAPSHHQSSNGLVESTWKYLVRMARAYLGEKQLGRDFWWFAVKHAVLMMNQIPGRLGRRLATPFELVHGVKPNACTWFQVFSVGFFPHAGTSESKSKLQTQTLDGIAVGRDDTSNTIIFYNPITKHYYRPSVFKLDESRLPATMYPKNVRFDGGLLCGLLRNHTDPVPEPFPPGARVSLAVDNVTLMGTVVNVPICVFPDISNSPATHPPSTYTIRLDDGTTRDCDLTDLITPPPLTTDPSPSASVFDSLPHIFHQNAKVTLDHDGTYHRGYINYDPTGGFQFVTKRHPSNKSFTSIVPLENFSQNWTTLLQDDIIFPGHGTISSWLRPKSTSSLSTALHVSARSLINACPPSLQKALHPSNPDRNVWAESYQEEKDGLASLDVYRTIDKSEYLALKKAGDIPNALPTMAVLIIKHDKDGNPLRAKSRIVVLGNYEDRIYSKSKRYAPVLSYSSLRLLVAKAVRDKCVLRQGDCKNAFCNAPLPDDERCAVRPPVGDPDYNRGVYWLLQKTLYGLRRSSRHWYDMFTTILTNIGLRPSPHDPCLFSGTIFPDPTDPPDRPMVHVGIYVDDFVFYSSDPAEEDKFVTAMSACPVPIDFMGTVDYFLGTAFRWQRQRSGDLSVHLSQAAFTDYTAHRFAIDSITPTPNMTPYRSGTPIDSIPPPDANDPDLKRRTKCYQAVVGCINWLATCTRPDIAPVLTFLASYLQLPHHQHYKSALHAVKYLYSTGEYGISFHSNARQTIQAFNHFPHHHDKEAYSDAAPPSPSECHQLTAFSDANWGGHFGQNVPPGTPLELFKFRSLSGYVVCCGGGPVSWKSVRQERTARSSCEAEINATDCCIKDLLSVKHRALDINMPDAAETIPVYNDNKSAVDWAATMTNKGTKHINLHENCVREEHQAKTVQVLHIPGVINASDIFTKELKDDAHFRRCRDCMMVSLSNFIAYNHTIPSHLSSRNLLPYYSIRSSLTPDEFRDAIYPKHKFNFGTGQSATLLPTVSVTGG